MALSSSVVWEVRANGNAANGGGFDPSVSVPGTDYSQQDSAQVSYTDLTAGMGSPDVTSAGNPFTSAHVGNILNITNADMMEAGYYTIISVSGSTATLDRNPTFMGSTAGVAKLGGATNKIDTVFGSFLAGQKFWIKADGIITSTGGFNLTPNNSATQWTSVSGYSATRGDGGQATLKTAASGSYLFDISGAGAGVTYGYIRNILWDGDNVSAGFYNNNISQSVFHLRNIKAYKCVTNSFISSVATTYQNCWASTMLAGSTSGFNNSAVGSSYVNCVASTNPCPGFKTTENCPYIHCIAAANTGASSDGFFLDLTALDGASLINCIAYGSGRDGVRINVDQTSDLVIINNCVFISNGAYGIRCITTSMQDTEFDYNAFYNNATAARLNNPAGPHDITLTADPFVSSSGNNFALNHTAGGGPLLYAAGAGNVTGFSTSSYRDVGFAQHPNPPMVQGPRLGGLR